LAALMNTFGAYAGMPFFFICAGLSAPAKEGTSHMLRGLFCYLCLPSYLIVCWTLLVVRPLVFIRGDLDPVFSPFAYLYGEIPLNRTWFLYTLFTQRGVLYPIAAANKYTLTFFFLVGALWTEFAPADDTVGIFQSTGGLCCCCGALNATVHLEYEDAERDAMVRSYITKPIAESVYFFAGVGLQRSRLFSKAAGLLVRNPWVRLWGLLPLIALLVPCFIPPYSSLKQRITPVSSTFDASIVEARGEDYLIGAQTTGLFVLPLVLLVVLSIAAITPVSRLPFITDGGSRTINGYLIGIHAGGLMYSHAITYT